MLSISVELMYNSVTDYLSGNDLCDEWLISNNLFSALRKRSCHQVFYQLVIRVFFQHFHLHHLSLFLHIFRTLSFRWIWAVVDLNLL